MDAFKSHRVYYLDLLRLFATMAVVMRHASGSCSRGESLGMYVGTIYDAVSLWCVPIFVMISGALFLTPGKQVAIRDLYGKYILRLFIALIVWQFLYAFVWDPFRPILLNILHGNPISYQIGTLFPLKYHLWFLPMLIGVYMFIPIMKAIAEKKQLMTYYLILWGIFTTLDFLHAMPSLHLDWFWKTIDYLHIRMIYGYSGYFLLGYYLSTIRIPQNRYTLIFVGVVMGVVTVMSRIYWNISSSYEIELSPNIILMSCTVFLLVRMMSENGCSAMLSRLENFARPELFGIYLIHPFFLSLLPYFPSFSGLISIVLIPSFCGIIFLLSLYSIRLLRKLAMVRYVC